MKLINYHTGGLSFFIRAYILVQLHVLSIIAISFIDYLLITDSMLRKFILIEHAFHEKISKV